MDYDRNDALLHWLFRQTQGDAWFRPNEENISSGVALRISDVNNPHPEFRVFPYENPSLEPFEAAVVGLNPVVAVKIRSAAVHAALANVAPEEQSIYVDVDTRIQVLDTMLHLPAAEKDQCAAFIRDERVLVVWSDSLDRIIPTCTDFEERLIRLLWRGQVNHGSPSFSFSPSNSTSLAHGSLISARSSVEGSVEALAPPAALAIAVSRPPSSIAHKRRSLPPSRPTTAIEPASGAGPDLPPQASQTPKRKWYGKKAERPSEHLLQNIDIEKAFKVPPRKMALYAPVYNGLAAGISFLFVGNGIKMLLQEWMLDGNAIRLALLSLSPLLFCVSLFFCLQLIQNLSMVIGPIEQYHNNSTYYSAVKPAPNPAVDDALPHITIQMPVYKESLETVLAPSIASLKKAMQTYARQGGTSSIFVNDDGLRVLDPEQRDARIAFYALHGIAWVARPGHGDLGEDVGEEEKQERRDEEKGVKEDPKPFFRAGRFKKASNMNYALTLTLKLEHHLQRLIVAKEEADREKEKETEKEKEKEAAAAADESSDSSGQHTATDYANGIIEEPIPVAGSSNANAPRTPRLAHSGSRSETNTPSPLGTSASRSATPSGANTSTATDSTNSHSNGNGNTKPQTLNPLSLEDQALALAIEEMFEESGRRHRPWAANARAARMGEVVLLVDSDTVVPEDCLRDAAREMGESPEVAILQHESDVMQVAHHYFENGIAYFTRRINRCISVSCANGEVAPFVGHNAFLRWRAIQDVAFPDPHDSNREKIWSESNVSEDFDMALRLMLKGYIVRWATYSTGGFKEGVSLSVDDELNRWQKYAYGCSELLFNPFGQWFRRGPIAKQIHRFMWCNAPMHYKISMLSYMFSYYGIAVAVTVSIINYLLLGFQFPVDGFYLHSFEIWLATTVVFFGSGTVGYTILQHRIGVKQLIPAFLENLMWIPFFFFFFGGLSIPLSQAILAHMFSYNISWSATIKEVQRSNFFKEIPKIAKRFWFPMSLSIVLVLGIVFCASSLVPLQWRVDGSGWAVIFPLSILAGCHILFPIVLNPWLMVFSY